MEAIKKNRNELNKMNTECISKAKNWLSEKMS